MINKIQNSKIDFFCVGAAKSGTTAMHYFLKQHPEIFVPEIKEIHHFAPDLIKEDDIWLNKNQYYSLFDKLRNEKIIGETSVFYLLSEIAANQIFIHNPKAKIIVMIRNPIEVIYSLHSQLVFNGDETITDFEKSLEYEKYRKNGEFLPKYTRIQKKHWYTYATSFSTQIKRFLNVFPENQIKLLLFDDFKKDNIKTTQSVYNFLGVDDSFIPNTKIINSNKKIKYKKIDRFVNIILDKTPLKNIKEQKKIIFKNQMKNLNSTIFVRKPLDVSTKNRLIDIFKFEIDNLSKIFNRDLSHWYK